MKKSRGSTKGSETESVVRACNILVALEHSDQGLRLRDIVKSTGLNKATAFRLLNTLQNHGMVIKNAKGEYLSGIIRKRPTRLRIGYAAQSDEFAFSRTVTESITAAAERAGVELITVDNAYSPVIALQNVDLLIKEDVNVVMEFQTDSSIASLISAKFLQRQVPLIAIEIPHPGATYFGANNPQAGLLAGRYLGRWAEANWKREVDSLILLGLPMAGSLPAARLTGALLGLREIIPDFDDARVQLLNGNGQFSNSLQVVRQYLRRSKHERILVAAVNDPSALGALEAFKEAGRLKHCAIVGQNASQEAVQEMNHRNTRLIGSVGYFPERYGEQLISLAMKITAHQDVPPAVFVKHQMVTPNNVHDFYLPSRQQQRDR